MILDIAVFVFFNSIIFLSLYSYGLLIINTCKFKIEKDIFFVILVGYTFIGIVAVFLHFFLPIQTNFLLLIILFSFILLLKFKVHSLKELFYFLFLLCFFGLILTLYSDHPIDANMYHHPFVSYLKSEKIIFGLANIQFRFGHISFLQYVQSIFTVNGFEFLTLSSINIILYTSFIFVFSKEVFYEKKFSFVFLVKILILVFLLIKLNRYREFGNDLIPFLIASYFFIKIFQEIYKPTNSSEVLINFIFLFFVLMFAHKITYIFSTLMFLALISLKKLKMKNFFLSLNFKIFSFFLIIWVLKNYINTSCLVYPVEQTCFKNSLFELYGLADVKNASFLSEIWAKGFIDHPNWQELDLKIYVKSFNWFNTWLSNHFVKILEIVSPLIIVIFYCLGIFYFNKKKITYGHDDRIIVSKINYLFFFIFIGFLFWLFKAPLFRYGAFYVLIIIILLFILAVSRIFLIKNFENLNYFKFIIVFSLLFFVFKNILRIQNSHLDFFPKTIINKNSNEFYQINIAELKLLKPKNDVCYYTRYICSHETPNALKILKFQNYYIFNK